MSDLAALRLNLELLREQFADAATKWPCLEHVLVQWPEDSPEFDYSMTPDRYYPQIVPRRLNGCIPSGILIWAIDVGGSRHTRGRATMQWTRREKRNLRVDVWDHPDEHVASLQRFQALAHAAARLVAKSGLWKDAETDWRGVCAERWVMFVHETNGGTSGRNRFFLPAPYEGALIEDFPGIGGDSKRDAGGTSAKCASQ